MFNIVSEEDGSFERQIIRKPADKVGTILQLVDDTEHIAKKFREVGFPSRWQQWRKPNSDWQLLETNDQVRFVNSGENKDMAWLRYRHLAPRTNMDEFAYARQRLGNARKTEWQVIGEGTTPRRIKDRKTGAVSAGALIRDYYEYNDRDYQFPVNRRGVIPKQNFWSIGAHWVGDLAVECDLQIESNTGTLAFDLVCLLYTSPSPRDQRGSRMPSSA